MKKSKKKILLHLRNYAHNVQLIVPPGETHPVLGQQLPGNEGTPRADWVPDTCETLQGREAQTTHFKIPLDQRTQTILYYELSPDEQNAVAKRHTTLPRSRK